MRITVDRLGDYAFQLDTIAGSAEADVAARLTSLWDDVSTNETMELEDKVAIMRREAAAAIADAENRYGAASAGVGSSMLSDCVSPGTTVPPGLDYPEIANEDSATRSARYWAGCIDGTDEGFGRFLAGVRSKVRRQVAHAADREVALSAQKMGRSDKRVRFARVPSGPACGFCIMLASRGFVYASRETAGEFTKFHDDCKCRIVAGMQGMVVDGYDPDGMYDRYRRCKQALGGDDRVWQDWLRLTPEERDRYGDGPRLPFMDRKAQREFDERYGKNADAFNDYYAHRITREMDTRDREWLYDGRSCQLTKERGAKPLEKERDVGTSLLSHGFNVEFVRETNRTRIKTADARLNGELWEFKIPEAWNGEHTIRNQFYKAANKGTPRLLISGTMNGAKIGEMAECVTETFRKGDYDYITEVLLLDADGVDLARLRRQ